MSSPAPQGSSPVFRGNSALIAGVVALALALRVARVLQTPNLYSSDPATRALFAEKLSAFGWSEVYASTIWPPVHFWLLSWGQWLGGTDPQLGARAVAVLLGALACWPAFLVAQRSALLIWPESTQSASICATLAGLLVALEPLGLRFSALTYAEVPCTFFVLATCAALLPDARGRPARWWLALPCLALACGLRYEAWLLAPLMLLCSNVTLKERIALTAASVAPASLWFIDRPRYFALNSVTREKMGDILPNLEPDRLGAIVGAIRTLLNNGLPVLLPLAALGLFVLLRNREMLVLPYATIAALAFPPIAAMLGHVPLFERYLQLPMTLLAIAAAVGALACARWAQSTPRLPARLSHMALPILAIILIGPLIPRTASGIGEVLDKGDPPLLGKEQDPLRNAKKKAADLAAQGNWQELDETALLLHELALQRPDLLVYIEPNLRTASYLYWRASIPPHRVAGFYQWTREDVRWEEDIDKVLHGWSKAIYVLVTSGGEAGKMLQIPGPNVSCQDLQNHRIGKSQLRCLAETRGYRIFEARPVAKEVPDIPVHEESGELHHENDSPRSKEREAAPGPT